MSFTLQSAVIFIFIGYGHGMTYDMCPWSHHCTSACL